MTHLKQKKHILGLKFFYTLSFPKCSIALYFSLLVPQSLMYLSTVCVLLCGLTVKTKLHGLSPRANYADRAAAAGRRS
jgi:hypothetical protein